MSHEPTATRKYVDETVRKPVTDLAQHVGDLSAHVSAADRARWDTNAKGEKGDNGAPGTDGRDGVDGKSAYEIACDNGFEGTEAEWLESLKGKVTFDALTPEQKESLKGDKGEQGEKGNQGEKGETGATGKAGTSVYVKSYEASSEPGGTSVLVLHDSRDTRIEIHNGRDGADGRDGQDGRDGADGQDGRDGTVSIDSMTTADREALLASIQEVISDDPDFVGEKGEPGERGSRWHASDVGTFSGDDTTPGNFSGVGTFVDDAQPGDMLLMTATRKTYECLAAAGEAYGGSTQPVSLWAYKMDVAGEKGEKGEKGDMSTFVPAATLSGMVNQSSVWWATSGKLVFPCPSVAEGQLLEYVLYVRASASVTIDPATSFDELTAAGYTVYSNNDNLMDTLPAGTIAAFTVSQMGGSNNVSIMRVLFGTAIAAPAAQ